MSEHDDRVVEALLRRYRPMDAPPAAIVGRTWPWAVAAAALLAITIGLHGAVIIGAMPAAADPAPLAYALGGDDVARQVAQFIVSSPRAPEPEPAMPWDAQ